MTRRILALTGRPGVGKSTAADKLAEIQGVPTISMGDEVQNRRDRNLTNGPSGVLTDDLRNTSTWQMAQLLRDEYGDRGVAMACLSKIATAFVEHDLVVVDGVRNVAEVGFFETVFACPVHLVAVTADKEVRLDRFAERPRFVSVTGRNISNEALRVAAEYEMDKRTAREEDAGLTEAIEYADYEFENSGDEDQLEAQCTRLIDDLIPPTTDHNLQENHEGY